jgi:hypothetical protein
MLAATETTASAEIAVTARFDAVMAGTVAP